VKKKIWLVPVALLLAMSLVITGCPQVDPQVVEIEFWTTEIEPDRMAVRAKLIARFEAANPGIDVDLIPVGEVHLPGRMIAAIAAGIMPDVVLHPVDFTVGWAAEGILDVAAATSVIKELGVETFAAGPLTFAEYGVGWTAVPHQGWGQLLLYRRDLFEEKGLATPDTWDAILAAAEALHNPPYMWGIALGNDPA